MTAFKVPKWKLLRVKDVKVSPHNPPTRTTKAAIRPLLQSMSKVGILYPILVDEKSMVIDGHRRLKAADELGWETIPAIIAPEGMDPSVCFATVNSCSRKMNGNESLSVWLQNKEAINGPMGKKFAMMQEVLGRPLVEELYSRGLTARFFASINSVWKYIGGKITRADIAKWLMNVAVVREVEQQISSGVSAKKLEKAIAEGRPIAS